ncbi:carbohydrate ABC transporter permease [Georgenia sp. AZ-5]|uniref:carbohydrate ABC transporter permease n=1 Tax=Georgenia sp. AZ-5 TaxID=3367526 RepID=UPI00375527B1
MTVVPAIYILRASFRNEVLLGTGGGWVGLDNYRDVLSAPGIRHSILVTLVFVGIVVALELVLGLVFALALSARTRASTVGTTLLLLPFAVTPVVSALIFKELLNPNYGWINYYFGSIGLPGNIEWLSHSRTAWVALIGLDVWQWTPFVALILIAGLQTIPPEPLEAAAIDGANRWQTFWNVVLPQLTPFIAIAVVLRTIQAFKTFDSFKVLTNGGPGTSTEIINLGIYRIALQSFQIGAASAMAVLLLIVLLLLTPALMRAVGRNAEPEEA